MPDFVALVLWLQVLVGLATSWTCVCRVALMTADTHRSIRYGMSALGAAGMALAVAPFMPALYSHAFEVLFALAALVMQLATSHLWSAGVPAQFRTDP